MLYIILAVVLVAAALLLGRRKKAQPPASLSETEKWGPGMPIPGGSVVLLVVNKGAVGELDSLGEPVDIDRSMVPSEEVWEAMEAAVHSRTLQGSQSRAAWAWEGVSTTAEKCPPEATHLGMYIGSQFVPAPEQEQKHSCWIWGKRHNYSATIPLVAPRRELRVEVFRSAEARPGHDACGYCGTCNLCHHGARGEEFACAYCGGS